MSMRIVGACVQGHSAHARWHHPPPARAAAQFSPKRTLTAAPPSVCERETVTVPR